MGKGVGVGSAWVFVASDVKTWNVNSVEVKVFNFPVSNWQQWCVIHPILQSDVGLKVENGNFNWIQVSSVTQKFQLTHHPHPIYPWAVIGYVWKGKGKGWGLLQVRFQWKTFVAKYTWIGAVFHADSEFAICFVLIFNCNNEKLLAQSLRD